MFGCTSLAARLLVLSWLAAVVWAQGAAKPAPKLTANRADEPIAAEVSLARAVAFADSTAHAWRARHECVTCHTNGLHLVSRAWLGDSSTLEANRAFARSYLKRYVEQGEKPRGRKGEVEGLVATTAMLAIGEAKSAGDLSAPTESALAHVFTLQSEAGHWASWLKCGWPPFEVDDHFGVTLVAVAVGMAPPAFRRADSTRTAIARLHGYLEAHPPANPHQKGMSLWASRHLSDIASRAEREAWVDELRELQRDDGGWVLADLGAGRWQRQDDTPQDDHSDAYATAFCVFTLRQGGVAATDRAIARGVAWLKANQRASGRWFTRSPRRDGKHFISHAATHFAIMALVECGEKL